MNNPHQFNLIYRPVERHTRGIWTLLLLLALPGMSKAQYVNAITNSDGTASIIACSGPGKTVTIPSMILGHPVTTILFCSGDGFTSITIPDSVTSIGAAAFQFCTSLAACRTWQSASYVEPRRLE